MATEYQINLSSGELYTLAGLLRFKCLYGIENNTAVTWQDDLLKHIHQTVKRLESRKLILVELNGKLLIDPHIRLIMELLCQPEKIVVVSGSARNGKTTTMYILEKEGVGITASRLDEDNYKIVLYSSYNVITILCNYFDVANSEPVHEKILLEDVKYIQDQIASFQPDAAKEYLSRCVQDQNHIDFFYGIFGKMNNYTEVRMMKRKKDFYETHSNFVISYNHDHTVFVSVSVDELNMLSIDSFDKKIVYEKISKFFAVDPKRST